MQDVAKRAYRVAFDIGGTFTDLIVAADDGTARISKILSTTGNYADAVIAALKDIFATWGEDPSLVSEVSHGTTVATNAILERRGAKTALLTTAGFQDVLEIGRLRMPGLYNLGYTRPPPLVPRRYRFVLEERMNFKGEVLEPLGERSLDAALDELKAAHVSSVAISLLHSYANPMHERVVADRIREAAPQLHVTLASDVDPGVGEFERTSTAVTNAYVMPLMDSYLRVLEDRIAGIGIKVKPLIMQSSGGVMSVDSARQLPVLLIESGPAAGVVGAAALARRVGVPNIISFDIGGTTAKASLIEDYTLSRTSEFQVGGPISEGSRLNNSGGFTIRAAGIDLAEVGAGGGSIVAVDSVGSLRVGPESAGSDPGPLCYDRGGRRATVTDANLCLGYLNPISLPSGLKLNAALARTEFEDQVARPLGLSVEEAAYGVFLVGSTAMARAIRAVTIERGHDPRAFAMVAFGGNGPLFAVALARALEIGKIIVPPGPGVFSAVGLLDARVERHLSRNFIQILNEVDPQQLRAAVDGMETEARALLQRDGFADDVGTSTWVDMKYQGQSFPLRVPFPPDAEQGFLRQALVDLLAQEHIRNFGIKGEDDAIQITAIRTIASRIRNNAAPPVRVQPGYRPHTKSRRAYYGAEIGFVETAVIPRDALDDRPRPGPFVVEEYDATTLVPPGASAQRDAHDNIIVETGI